MVGQSCSCVTQSTPNKDQASVQAERACGHRGLTGNEDSDRWQEGDRAADRTRSPVTVAGCGKHSCKEPALPASALSQDVGTVSSILQMVVTLVPEQRSDKIKGALF